MGFQSIGPCPLAIGCGSTWPISPRLPLQPLPNMVWFKTSNHDDVQILEGTSRGKHDFTTKMLNNLELLSRCFTQLPRAQCRWTVWDLGKALPWQCWLKCLRRWLGCCSEPSSCKWGHCGMSTCLRTPQRNGHCQSRPGHIWWSIGPVISFWALLWLVVYEILMDPTPYQV